MEAFAIVQDAGWYLGTLLYCVAAGLLPFLSTELFLLWLAATAPAPELPGLLATACAAHMAAKAALFAVGRGAVRLPLVRNMEKLEGDAGGLADSRSTTGVAFMSALIGLPPFYWIAVAAGALGVPFRPFFTAASAGRILRFAAVLFLPQLLAYAAALAARAPALVAGL